MGQTISSDTSSSSDSLVTDEDSTTAADSEEHPRPNVKGKYAVMAVVGHAGTVAKAQCDEAGQCVCRPSCDEQECGDDGCGGSCGSCGDINDPCLDGACEDGQCIESPIEGSVTMAILALSRMHASRGLLGQRKDCDDDNPVPSMDALREHAHPVPAEHN